MKMSKLKYGVVAVALVCVWVRSVFGVAAGWSGLLPENWSSFSESMIE